MKPATAFCALFAIALGAQIISSHVSATNASVMAEQNVEECYLEDNAPFSGMNFCSDNVIQEYEYDDAYCLLYDDADANMFNVEICVDLDTYLQVIKCHEANSSMNGTLWHAETSLSGVEVFTYVSDEDNIAGSD